MFLHKSVLLLHLFTILSLSGPSNGEDSLLDTIETLTFKDTKGIEHEEYAFRAPMKGVPENVLDIYCANIKLRLYWDVFRQQVKDTRGRTDIFLRRLARMARHTFDEVRDVDKPFQGKMLSVIDKYFAVSDKEDEADDERKKEPIKSSGTLKSIKNKLGSNDNSISETELADLDIDSISEKGQNSHLIERLKSAYHHYAPKVGIGIYTRWRTMWWLTMPCIFTKYYLWDSALDEFMKLKRTLVMYPDFLRLRLQDVDCKPVKFFRRILDVCKILNPLMHISFGQLSLDQMMRFKIDNLKN